MADGMRDVNAEMIRSLLDSKPFDGSQWGLTPEELYEFRSLGLGANPDARPDTELEEYRMAKSLGPQDFARWRAQKLDQHRKRLFPQMGGHW